jgi:hypothetical protein
MTQGKQFGLSATQKIAIWSRWKAGQSLHEIGRAFGKSHSSIRCVVSHHGGFVPALRQRLLPNFCVEFFSVPDLHNFPPKIFECCVERDFSIAEFLNTDV